MRLSKNACTQQHTSSRSEMLLRCCVACLINACCIVHAVAVFVVVVVVVWRVGAKCAFFSWQRCVGLCVCVLISCVSVSFVWFGLKSHTPFHATLPVSHCQHSAELLEVSDLIEWLCWFLFFFLSPTSSRQSLVIHHIHHAFIMHSSSSSQSAEERQTRSCGVTAKVKPTLRTIFPLLVTAAWTHSLRHGVRSGMFDTLKPISFSLVRAYIRNWMLKATLLPLCVYACLPCFVSFVRMCRSR